mmetsp:Transcript_18354/g.31238  ORF Transcript_18354/g.31238 Transcript_18354/m.31238 type:complete len:347 (-) Transcript_18354:315-1355(-)
MAASMLYLRACSLAVARRGARSVLRLALDALLRNFRTNAVVLIHGRPGVPSPVQLDLVRADLALLHLFRPEQKLRHRACHPLAARHRALDAVADLEAERLELPLDVLGGREAGFEGGAERGAVEVLADEDELVALHLVLVPRLEVAVEDHVHGLVDELGLGVLDGEHALHAVDVGALGLEDLAHPVLHEVEVDVALLHHAQAAHRVVVLVLPVGVEELGVHLERPLQVEALDAEDAVDGDLGPVAAQDRRERVERLQPPLDSGQVLLRHEVRLVEEQPVGERDLLHRLVLGALGLLLVEVLLDVLRVDQRDHAVEAGALLDRLVHEEGLHDRSRVGEASRLDDDGV